MTFSSEYGNIIQRRKVTKVRAKYFDHVEDLAWSIDPAPEAYAFCFTENDV